MASVTYLGKNGGSNAEFEAAKVEALAIQNELNRLKLEKLRAALIERDQVELVIADALVILRERILSLPRQLVGLLRGMEHAKLHGNPDGSGTNSPQISMRIDHRFGNEHQTPKRHLKRSWKTMTGRRTTAWKSSDAI